MPETAIAADVHKSLDIELDFAAQRTFELHFGDLRADGGKFVVIEFVGALVPVDVALGEDTLRRRATDAEDVS